MAWTRYEEELIAPPVPRSPRVGRAEDRSFAEQASGSQAVLPYEAVRTAADPRAALLAFLERAYLAGGGLEPSGSGVVLVPK